MSNARWILMLSLVACAQREVEVVIHTPVNCCTPVGDRACVEDPCPLRMVTGISVRLEGADGTTTQERCIEPPDELCTYEDLSDFVFLDGIEPSDGVELRVVGYEDEDCELTREFDCESFGDNVIDLREDGTSVVPLWCDCPRGARE